MKRPAGVCKAPEDEAPQDMDVQEVPDDDDDDEIMEMPKDEGKKKTKRQPAETQQSKDKAADGSKTKRTRRERTAEELAAQEALPNLEKYYVAQLPICVHVCMLLISCTYICLRNRSSS